MFRSPNTSFDIREFGILNSPVLDSALQVILECDKLKAIERRSRPVGMRYVVFTAVK